VCANDSGFDSVSLHGWSGGAGMDSGGPVNQPPVAQNDSGGAVLGRLLTAPGTYDPLLANDYDPDYDPIWFNSLVQQPSHGVITQGPTSDGSFQYVPQKVGMEGFTYTITDGELESDPADVNILITAPPVGIDAPGSVHLNHDDDNGNAVQDRYEGPGPLEPPGGGPFNDNDLLAVSLTVDGQAASTWVATAAGGAEGYLAGVELRLSHGENLKLWRTQDKAPLDLVYAFDPGPPANVPDVIYVEGVELTTGSGGGSSSIAWELFAPSDNAPQGEVVASASVEIAVVEIPPTIDLDAYRIERNVAAGLLPDDQEDYPGAFVPLNNDDDDYDPAHAQDRQQQGAIAGESDLLPIVFHRIDPLGAGGQYRLHVPANVRVWQNGDRTGSVPDLTVFAATVETTLYVEGVSAGAGILYVDWWNGQQTINGADTLAVTVFDWIGPLNVPDYSKHEYRATGAASGQGNSMWLAPEGGSIASSTPGDATDVVVIHWLAGPAVGKARYQADPNYIWDLEVNVVEVRIQSPDEDNPFVAGTPSDGGQVDEAGTTWKLVESGSPAIEWAAKVTLNGPKGDRGVTFMNIGFVQNAEVTAYKGMYQTVGRPLTSSIEGQTYIDCEDGSTPPYYTVTESAVFFDPSPTNKVRVLFAEDSPIGGAPLTYDQGLGVSQDDDVLDSIQLVWDFHLCVTARTTDSRNNANAIYTSRARVEWEFNGSGDIAQTSPYAWSAVGAEIIVPAAWTPVTEGWQPPKMAGVRFTDALNNDTWQ
jgi:hypothetical protein